MRRVVVIALAFAVTLTGFVAFARTRWLGPATDAGRKLYEHRLRMEGQLKTPWPPTGRHVLVMGDSTIMTTRSAPSWPVLMKRPFAARDVGIVQETYPGQDTFHHYCVLPAFLDRKPDVIVVVLNMRVMSPNRRTGVAMDLCSFLPPSVLARSLDFPWQDRQASLVRVALMRTLTIRWVEDSVIFLAGLRRLFVDTWMPTRGRVLTRHAFARRRAGYYDQPIMPRHPLVRALGALVREIERAGSGAVVVVSPVPFDSLREFLSVDPGVWTARMSVLRAAVEDAGGTFVDLHALLDASGFRDPGGHMTAEGHARISRAVSAAVAQRLGLYAGPAPSP